MEAVKSRKRASDMTQRVQVETITPLLDIQSSEFLHQYQLGLWWSLFGEREDHTPIHDTYLFENLKTCAKHNLFNGEHEAELSHISFYIGMLHGGVLEPMTGEIKQGQKALVTLQDEETKRGYRAGREFVFCEAYPDQKRFTDTTLIERLRESITEMTEWGDSDDTWKYSIGCVLGEVSCQLFPETAGEREHWQKVKQRIEARLAKAEQTRHTDPLPVLTLMES